MRLLYSVFFSFFCGFCYCVSANASASAMMPVINPVLNKIYYQTSVEQWVSAQTAEVVLSINATLNESQLVKAHGDILDKLKTISPSEWHITQFNRVPNDSGLEQLQVIAQTRLSEEALASIREKAKKASKPGETFKIDSITFQPTLQEMEFTRKQLRDKIYQQIQTELANVNKLYANQHYLVNQISFTENNTNNVTEGLSPSGAKLMMATAEKSVAMTTPVTVVNKMLITANIVLVSISQ